MSHKSVEIMDIPFQNCTQKYFIDEKVKPKFFQEEKCFIVTANPEIVMETRSNERYKQAVLKADYVVPDGIGILLAAKWQKTPLTERIAGYDLMIDLLNLAEEEKARCFFLGGRAEVNEATVAKIKNDFPNIVIAGSHHGYFDIDDESIWKEVQASKADFVFVALGFPKQEEWIVNHLEKFSKGIFIGVGGSFDVISGHVKRAPSIWIKLHLEWLYRLVKQPSRWKRILPIFKFIGISFFNRNKRES